MKIQIGSLTIVGTGIKSISHLTVEAITYIQQSDKVYYSVNEPIVKEWLHENNTSSESLDVQLNENVLRRVVYENITQKILANIKNGQHVCVVFYGHPTIFADAALAAAKQAKHDGFHTIVMPGISAEACLFADLLIDPGSHGCQSFEATDLLLRGRQVDTTCHLILWQVGMIGNLRYDTVARNEANQLELKNYLVKSYGDEYIVTAYEASIYPHIPATITNFELKDMSDQAFSSLTTLYIPPTHKNKIDLDMMKKLNISDSDLLTE